MGSNILWLTPLLLLPGVGMLILSTSNRLNELHDEIHQLLHEASHQAKGCAHDVVQRSLLFRNALVSLYFSVISFSLAGLLGSLTQSWEQLSFLLTTALTVFGIASIVYASSQLIRESFSCTAIIQSHALEIHNKTSKLQQ